jgi:DNA-directed RNA polymerase specialized sigma24 family protein
VDESWRVKMLELETALEALTRERTSLARIVEMHYFGGMTAEEMAMVLGRSAHAVRHDLRVARAWLRRELAR